MLINEVESLVGLTKKSIRFYEENGLINPIRENNSYRIYNDEDIRRLKLIKFFRNLGVSVNDINRLFKEELTLHDCLIDRVADIRRCKDNFNEMELMCQTMLDNNTSLLDFDDSNYIIKMNVLIKNGFTLKRGDDSLNKKMFGPILSSIISILFFGCCIGLILWANSTDPIPLPILVFIIIMFVIPITGIVANLFIRIKEIKGGEEDEASKY